jgi:hypothetical protein
VKTKNHDFNGLWVWAIILVLALGLFSIYESIHAEDHAGSVASSTDVKLAQQLRNACEQRNKVARQVDDKINAIIATSGGGTSLQQSQVDQITDPTVRAIFQRVLDVGSASRDALKKAAGKPLPQQDCKKIGAG